MFIQMIWKANEVVTIVSLGILDPGEADKYK